MSGKKYSFSKDIAESLGITEAIILDFYQNNHQDLSLDNLKNEFKFLEVSQLENSFKRLVKLGLFIYFSAHEQSMFLTIYSINFNICIFLFFSN